MRTRSNGYPISSNPSISSSLPFLTSSPPINTTSFVYSPKTCLEVKEHWVQGTSLIWPPHCPHVEGPCAELIVRRAISLARWVAGGDQIANDHFTPSSPPQPNEASVSSEKRSQEMKWRTEEKWKERESDFIPSCVLFWNRGKEKNTKWNGSLPPICFPTSL